MEIDISKKYTPQTSALLDALTKESRARLIEAANEFVYNKNRRQHPHDFWEMTFDQFVDCEAGDFLCVGIDPIDMTIAEYMWVCGFAEFVEKFGKALEKLTPKATADERQANSVCLPTTFDEAMMVFLRDYFGLRSFDECGKITLSQLLVAKKSEYNKIMYGRKMAEIQRKRLKNVKK